jgi:hypothetical protein
VTSQSRTASLLATNINPRYLFGGSHHFINPLQANIDLAATCLTYLCSELFDLEIGDEDIARHILAGAYRLHAFAASQWTKILKRVASLLRGQKPTEDLIVSLERFVAERHNTDYDDQNEEHPEPNDFRAFNNLDADLYRQLRCVAGFPGPDVVGWRLDQGKWEPLSDSSIVLGLKLAPR